jgi:hypothetical protein
VQVLEVGGCRRWLRRDSGPKFLSLWFNASVSGVLRTLARWCTCA